MRLAALTALAVLLGACQSGTEAPGILLEGSWGGENAGVLVTDSGLHVHIGCTFGDAPLPGLAPDGRFEVTGRHNITAYPIDAGVFHPARFSGRVRGDTMSLTVTLTDTAVTLGPVRVVRGHDPRLGPCPICRSPGDRRAAIITP